MLGSLGLQCVRENRILGEEVEQSQQIPAPEEPALSERSPSKGGGI
jgi:hypothetical protein